MNQQLIPIIAAYWGAETSHLNGWANPEQTWETLNENNFHHISRPSFKLHLRPLWSITEDELRELFVWHGYKSEYLFIEASFTQKRIAAYDRALLLISDSKVISPHFASHLNVVGLINKLREWQFCVDQELVDANLVEWKEVGNGSN